jgi:hypothetical protein
MLVGTSRLRAIDFEVVFLRVSLAPPPRLGKFLLLQLSSHHLPRSHGWTIAGCLLLPDVRVGSFLKKYKDAKILDVAKQRDGRAELGRWGGGTAGKGRGAADCHSGGPPF